MHRWNRALADASLVLVALSMGLGPLARLLRPAVLVLPYRRESGIYGCLLALAHAAIILVGWVEWDEGVVRKAEDAGAGRELIHGDAHGWLQFDVGGVREAAVLT